MKNDFVLINFSLSNEMTQPQIEASPVLEAAAKKILQSLWRSDNRCHQIGILNRESGLFSNIPVSSVDEAIRLIKANSTDHQDLYHACAEYSTPNNRRADNTSGACGFWLDIDCGEEKSAMGTGYAALEDAKKAVDDFCRQAVLPNPTHIVNSGSGLHVYWGLDVMLPRNTWKTSALKLKSITEALDLRADPSRTADIASVLRIPGTLNHKYDPPRPVVLLCASEEPICEAVMLGAIDEAHERLCHREECCVDYAMHSDDGESEHIISPFAVPPKEPPHITFGVVEILLGHIDPDVAYNDWRDAIMATHFETRGSYEGLTRVDSWSKRGQKYKGKGEIEKMWRSFRTDLPNYLKRGTLFRLAKQNGYPPEMINAEIGRFIEVSAKARGGSK